MFRSSLIRPLLHRISFSLKVPTTIWQHQKLQLPASLTLIPRKLFSAISDKGNSNNATENKLKTGQQPQFKQLWQKYGYLSIGFYVGLYVTTLSGIFVSLDFDLFRASTFGFDPIESVKKFCDFVEYMTGSVSLPAYIRENPRVGTFAIAWVMTKFTEPLRLAFTIAVMPTVAKFVSNLRRTTTTTETN